jgi:hypothetical protein
LGGDAHDDLEEDKENLNEVNPWHSQTEDQIEVVDY